MHAPSENSTSTHPVNYKEILDFLPEIVFETDLRLNLIFVNELGFKKFGYTREEFRNGVNLADVIAPESIEFAVSNIKSIFEGSNSKPAEYLLQRKDKTTFYGRVHSKSVKKDDKVVGLRGIVFDISELKETRRKLHDSEDKFKSIVEH